MRNLSYSEAALSLLVIGMASGLSYFAWFRPVLEQMREDRLATRTLLFDLASRRPAAQEAREDAVVHGAEARPPMAFRPDPVNESLGRKHPKLREGRKTKPRLELELGEGTDPLADLPLEH